MLNQRDVIVEEHVEMIKQFITTPAYEWAIRQYNKVIVSKLTNLQRSAIGGDLSKINVEAGQVGGFKEGFEFLEKITKGGGE